MTDIMKLNLWVLADQLGEFGPISNITGTEAKIEGFRLCYGAEQALDDSKVYLYREHDGICLRNGNNTVFLPQAGMEEVLNAGLVAYERIQSWEADLNRLTSERSLQGLLDTGVDLLENPMLLSDCEGNVLAMSSAFVAENLGLSWCTARDEGHISMEVMTAPMYDEAGELSSWGDEPTLFHLQDNDRLITSYIRAGGSQAAVLGLREHQRPIRNGDLLLFGRLCEAISSALEENNAEYAGRSMADLLRDILDGRKIEPELLTRMEPELKRPWQMILVSNPFRSDTIHQRSLLYRSTYDPRPNISFLYENRVVILMSEKDAAAQSKEMSMERGQVNHQLVVSLPFDELRDMPVRYQQCVYAAEQLKDRPGIHNSKNFCFAYLLKQFAVLNGEQNLSHPALTILKRYDQKKNTEYYRTLFVYLLYERSILLCAEHLHIHKNTFLYRIQKIRDMLDVDLDDPAQRGYLMLSYYMEGER